MDGMKCDQHSSAWAKARVTLANGGVLYVCQHCANTLDFGDAFGIDYDKVTV